MAYNSEKKARRLNAWSTHPAYRDLWGLSKRELIEIALHLAGATTDSCEEALESGEAGDIVRAERRNLRAAGLV